MSDGADEVPLRDHMESRLADLEKLVATNFKAHEREHELMEVVRLADKVALEKHLGWLNEMRGALRDERAERERTFSRVEHEAYAKGVEIDLRVLRESRAEMQGKANQSNLNVTFFIAVVGCIVAAVDMILRIFGK
jgi:hypothetical protein